MAILLDDCLGLARVCGIFIAARWLLSVLVNLQTILRHGNLLCADDGLGQGPFTVRMPTCKQTFRVAGHRVISGIREIYVRDCYLGNGRLEIRENDVVVDLGANMGNFTNFALAHGENVRVVSVEPNLKLNQAFEYSLRLNPRHIERARLMRGFVGGVVDRQKAVMDPDPNYFGAPWLTEDQLITQCGLEHVDFLKCDIEGGEFALLGGQSRLLAMTRSLAMEIHAFAGDVDWLIGKLISQGFQIISRDDAPDGSCVILAKRA